MPGRGQLGVEPFRRLAQPNRLVHVHRQQHHVKRRDGGRPHDAPLVVVLLDGGRDHPGHTDPVAAHDQVDRTSFVVEHDRAHRLAVLVSELEDVPDLDSPADREGSGSVRTRVAVHRIAKIGDHRLGRVPSPAHTGEVRAVTVGPAHEIGKRRRGRVGDDRHAPRRPGPASPDRIPWPLARVRAARRRAARARLRCAPP